jgi:predicted O-linked N-acetylglucosamine transferase (SPINDLY family)
MGRTDDAVNCFRKAIELNPSMPEAYLNLGGALQMKGLYDEALACLMEASDLSQESPEIYNNVGTVLKNKGHFDEAISYFNKAISLKPDFADAYYNLGNTLIFQSRNNEAISAFDRALAVQPGFIKAQLARCMAHLQFLYHDESDIQRYRKQYEEELIKLRDDVSDAGPLFIDKAAEAIGGNQPFFLPYQGMNDRDLQKIYGEMVCGIMGKRYPKFASPCIVPPRTPGEPLRIGFVSGYFYLHSNWKIPIRGWVENLDRQRFRLYGYYMGTVNDAITDEARKIFDCFRENTNSLEEMCEIIRADDLHVLIYPEIGMCKDAARLAALRLAPVQCTSWGHPVTSGFPTVDYYLSSALMEPPDGDDQYTERLVRLPNLSIHYVPLLIPEVTAGREVFGLRSYSTLYLCPQSLFKYLPQYDLVFPEIARKIRNCQLVFISANSDLATGQFKSRIRDAFNRYDLQADDYTVFLPRLEPSAYNSLIRLADVFLDSIGWSGCNSTFEAIAHDIPVVTLPGRFMRGRHSFAILTMMGVTETIASSIDEYISLAVRLGEDSVIRQSISDKIAANKHRLYGDRTCITALEDFLEKAVK